MADGEKSNRGSSSDELKESVGAFWTAGANLFRALQHFLRWFWVWVQEQHPFVQAIVSLPITFLTIRIADIFAKGIYTTFWVKSIPVNGSLYVTGLPVPISVAIYFLLVLLIITMLSNHRNRKEIESLKERIEA